jgi:hypothetical protein
MEGEWEKELQEFADLSDAVDEHTAESFEKKFLWLVSRSKVIL